MDLIQVPINKVSFDKKHYNNTRLDLTQDVASLMTDIKHNGLLQPIGVSKLNGDSNLYRIVYGNRRFQAVKKLGWKEIDAVLVDDIKDESDYLFKNFAENDQRQNLSVYEQGRFYQMLLDNGLSMGEISSRVGKGVATIKSCMVASAVIPEQYRKSVVPVAGGRRARAGQIPQTVFNEVHAVTKTNKLTQDDFEELLKIASTEKVHKDVLKKVGKFIKQGVSPRKAIDSIDDIKVINFRLIVSKKNIERIKKRHGVSVHKYIASILEEYPELS